MAANIQSLIDKVPRGGTLKLDPPRAEHQGPIVIREPMTIVGQGCSFWSEKGPVLQVLCSGVVLKDLNIEVTSNRSDLADAEACSLYVAPQQGISLSQVVVRGTVVGLDGEQGAWGYPRTVPLGAIKAGVRHSFALRLNVPVPCRIESEIAGLEVAPKNVPAGSVEVVLSIDSLSAGTRLRGFVKLQTQLVTRCIQVTCNVQNTSTAIIGTGQVVDQPRGWGSAADPPPKPKSEPVSLPVPPQIDLANIPVAKLWVEPVSTVPPAAVAPSPVSPVQPRRMRQTPAEISGAFAEQPAGGTISSPELFDSAPLSSVWEGSPTSAAPEIPKSPPARRVRQQPVSNLFLVTDPPSPSAETPNPEATGAETVPESPPAESESTPTSPPVKPPRKTRDLPGLFQ